jgi:hypothetical protein
VGQTAGCARERGTYASKTRKESRRAQGQGIYLEREALEELREVRRRIITQPQDSGDRAGDTGTRNCPKIHYTPSSS